MRAPDPDIQELDAHPLEGDEDGAVSAIQATRSIPPDSLKKPFASLMPQQLKASGPPIPPSQLFAETASLRPQQPSLPPGRAPGSERARTNPTSHTAERSARTTSPRPGETKDRVATARRVESAGPKRAEAQRNAKYGTCKTHGTALSPEGTCILCVRTEAKARSQRSMRWIVALLTLAVLGGAAIALNTLR